MRLLILLMVAIGALVLASWVMWNYTADRAIITIETTAIQRISSEFLDRERLG